MPPPYHFDGRLPQTALNFSLKKHLLNGRFNSRWSTEASFRYTLIVKALFCFFVILSLPASSFAQFKTPSEPECQKSREKFETQSESLVRYLFPEQNTQGPRQKKIKTTGLFIVQNACPLLERYTPPFGEGNKFLAWSVSKSVMSLLIGRAEKLGLLHRNDLLSKYYPDWKHPHATTLRIEDLLFWSSGLKWQETYEFAPFFSDVVAMLFTAGKFDMPAYVLSRPFDHPPGKYWRYSTGDSTLLAGVLSKALNSRSVYEFAEQEFFGRLGIGDWTWESDENDNLSGGTYLFASTKSFAKIGVFILQDGRWNDEPLLPDDWISYTTSLAPSFLGEEAKGEGAGGGHWWLNHIRNEELAFGGAPKDLYTARGHWGQYLTIIPSLQAVIVRFGDELEDSLPLDIYFQKLAKSLEVNP